MDKEFDYLYHDEDDDFRKKRKRSRKRKYIYNNQARYSYGVINSDEEQEVNTYGAIVYPDNYFQDLREKYREKKKSSPETTDQAAAGIDKPVLPSDKFNTENQEQATEENDLTQNVKDESPPETEQITPPEKVKEEEKENKTETVKDEGKEQEKAKEEVAAKDESIKEEEEQQKTTDVTNNSGTLQQPGESVKMSKELGKVKKPTIGNGTDKEGAKIESDSTNDMRVEGLTDMAQIIRDEGTKLQVEAEEAMAEASKGKEEIENIDQKVAKSDEDLNQGAEKVAEKKEIVNSSEKALKRSKENAATTQRETTPISTKAKEERGNTQKFSSEAGKLSGESTQQTAKDEDGKVDPNSGKLTAALRDIKAKADTIHEAVVGSDAKADTLLEEAEQAKGKNQESEAGVNESKEKLNQGEEKVKSSQEENEKAKGDLNAIRSQPDEALQQAMDLKKDGEELVTDSNTIEQDVGTIQQQYFEELGEVPGEQELLQAEQGKIEKGEVPLSEGESLLFAMTSLTSEEEIQEFFASLSDMQLVVLSGAFSEVEASMQEAETMESTEDESALPASATEIRAAHIMVAEDNRTSRLKKPEALVTKNIDKISAEQRRKMALGLMLNSLWRSISNITWSDVGNMLLSMLNPITGPKDAFLAILNQDWKESWEADPLGLILRTAINVSNLALTVLGSATLILGILSGLAWIGTIFSLGVAGGLGVWLTAAALAAGKWTIITGAISAYLNYCNLLKNTYELATAKNADELFGNVTEMQQDAGGILNGVASVVPIKLNLGAAFGRMGRWVSSKIRSRPSRSPKPGNTKPTSGNSQGIVSNARGKITQSLSNKGGLIKSYRKKLENFFKNKKKDGSDLDNASTVPENTPDAPSTPVRNNQTPDGPGNTKPTPIKDKPKPKPKPDSSSSTKPIKDKNNDPKDRSNSKDRNNAGEKTDLSKLSESDIDAIYKKIKNKSKKELTSNTPEHKAQRWHDYKKRKGKDALDYEVWSKRYYEPNQTRAIKANQAAKEYHDTLNWGEGQTRIDVGGETRILDIGDEALMKGVEFKNYSSQKVPRSKEILRQAELDKKLVAQGWEIEWVFKDKGPNGPLTKFLEDAGIKINMLKK